VKALSGTAAAAAGAKAAVAKPAEPSTPGRHALVERPAAQKIDAIGLVASTGGPIALRTFFKALPNKTTPPIFIVQHIAAGFSIAFASWLNTATGRTVKVAENGDQVTPGVVYVAPDDHQLAVIDGKISITTDAAVDGARPSGTVMLASLAKSYGAGAAGVLLTGTALLRGLGYRVAAVGGGREALDAVRDRTPGFDLVVCDHNMPDCSGIDVARSLAASHAGLPVVIYSGYIDAELQARASALGVRALVQKENSVEELGATIRRVLAEPLR